MSDPKKPTRREPMVPPRKPYERPAVISDEVFETLALSCAKADMLTCPGGNPDRS